MYLALLFKNKKYFLYLYIFCFCLIGIVFITAKVQAASLCDSCTVYMGCPDPFASLSCQDGYCVGACPGAQLTYCQASTVDVCSSFNQVVAAPSIACFMAGGGVWLVNEYDQYSESCADDPDDYCVEWFVSIAECIDGGYWWSEDHNFYPGNLGNGPPSGEAWNCYANCEDCWEDRMYARKGYCDNGNGDDDADDDADDDNVPPGPPIIQPRSSLDKGELSLRKTKLIGSGYKPRSTQQLAHSQEYPDFLPSSPSRLPQEEESLAKQISAHLFHLLTQNLFKP